MTTIRRVSISSMSLRQQWLQKLGGLEGVSVRNKEWLHLLEEDTRQSLMIEGFFIDRRALKETIESRNDGQGGEKILGYFDAAVASYEHAFQQNQTKEFNLTKALIRQIHSMMFRIDPRFSYSPGEWRRARITITGAKVETLQAERIEDEIERLISAINDSDADPVRKAAIAHAVFEQIHPFPDGNGRTGRIFLNFILVAHGLPNIAIKGNEKERKEYISALEAADDRVLNILSGKIAYEKFFQHPPIELEDLINRNLAVALDTVICSRFEEKTGETLSSLDAIAIQTKKNIESLRVACSQKKIICHKIGGRLVTHPLLLTQP